MRIETCARKIRYGHQETAERAVESMVERGAGRMEAYTCEACAGWHIGHRYRPTISLTIPGALIRTILAAFILVAWAIALLIIGLNVKLLAETFIG